MPRGIDAAYVLVTAAHNEEARIAGLLEAVAAQTLRPRRWIVASDGSTDRTDAIVLEHARAHPYVELLRVDRSGTHTFAAKVRALRQALARVQDTPHDFVGVLDADVWMEPHYFERLIAKFLENPRLGVGGGLIEQVVDGRIVPRVKDLESVAGAVQLLRRACMEQTGGLPELHHGGEDAALEIAARMHGWETRTFPELRVRHDGLVGASAGGPLRARFTLGRVTFSLGYLALYELARCAFRAGERPRVLGSIAELAGFAYAYAVHRRPGVDPALVAYLQREQKEKLERLFHRYRPQRTAA